jgi:hypothetical protein
VTDSPTPADLERAMRDACTQDCKLYYARRLVRARFDAGYYDGVLQALPDWLAEALAEMEVRQCS